MSQRIEKTFAKTRAENRAALIPFIMGYDPDVATSAALLAELPAAGADLIEIGIPFSDPMAHRPVIEAAGQRALKAGATLFKILELVRGFRAHNQDTPIILMGYFNPIYRYGVEEFCKDATEAGVDGLIIVDLPPEEDSDMRSDLDRCGLKLIRLIAPTSKNERLKLLCDSASGFVYYISITGITGAKAADTGALKAQIEGLRDYTELPVAVGFGIKTPEQVKEVAGFADAVVVGSALVNVIAGASGPKVKVATDFISQLAKALTR